MPIAEIAKLNQIRFTHQELASLMLSEDQARRRELARGNRTAAARHDRELGLLAELMS